MKFGSLQQIQKENFGYITGNFKNVFHLSDFEVAVKFYKKGETNSAHYHPESNEINIILSGKAMMRNLNDKTYSLLYADDILRIDKGEVFDFMALEDTLMIVIKDTSLGDKIAVEGKMQYSEGLLKYFRDLGIDVDKVG